MKEQERKLLTRIIAKAEGIYEEPLFIYEVSRDEDEEIEVDFKGIYESRPYRVYHKKDREYEVES